MRMSIHKRITGPTSGIGNSRQSSPPKSTSRNEAKSLMNIFLLRREGRTKTTIIFVPPASGVGPFFLFLRLLEGLHDPLRERRRHFAFGRLVPLRAVQLRGFPPRGRLV